MQRKYVYSNHTWHDVVSANHQELREIGALYSLDEKIMRRICNEESKSRVSSYGEYVFITLVIPYLPEDTSARLSKKSVGFLLHRDFILSCRSEDIGGFKAAKKTIAYLQTPEGSFPLMFFAHIMNAVYEEIIVNYQTYLETSHTDVQKFQQHRKVIAQHGLCLTQLSVLTARVFPSEQSLIQLQSTTDQYERLWTILQKENGYTDIGTWDRFVEQWKAFWSKA